MKKFVAIAALAALSLASRATEVYFSPNGGAEAAVVREVAAAKQSIFVMSYQMTNARIQQALVDAHTRGVRVSVILDKSQKRAGLEGQRYCCGFKLAQSVPTWVDAKHPIQHNKVMVIDGQTVITGSFNFSNAAEKANAENMLVLRDADLAAKYTANWRQHLSHSVNFIDEKIIQP